MLVQSMSEPVYCRPAAYQLFVDSLPELETLDGLLNAAIAISMHAIDDINPDDVRQPLWELAARVTRRAKSGASSALVAHLHAVLFDEEMFCGNSENYFSAINSYLPCVLRQKRGLPIALALIYKAVGERAGVVVHGVNSPGHFLLRVYDQGVPMIVDPFFRGQMLTRDEAFERLRHVTNRRIPNDDRLLAAATHRQWIGRMINNLQSLFQDQGNHCDGSAMKELRQALG
jgi:regulator of sirC expression with transglutaminase-like and TPR domain